jgi:hypothetical protein
MDHRAAYPSLLNRYIAEKEAIERIDHVSDHDLETIITAFHNPGTFYEYGIPFLYEDALQFLRQTSFDGVTFYKTIDFQT